MSQGVQPPAVMPGTPTPPPYVESAISSWADQLADTNNRNALVQYQAACVALQAQINDGQSGWFYKASQAAAAGQPLPPQYPLPTMTWSYSNGKLTVPYYDQVEITPVPNPPLVYPTIHVASSNPNPGVIAANPTAAAQSTEQTMQFIASGVAALMAKFGVTLAVLLAVLLVAPIAHAQVMASCSPAPIAATRGAGEKVMGPWECWLQNRGSAPSIVNPSDFFSALIGSGKMSPIGPNVANQIISDSVNRLPQSKALKIGKVAASLGAIAYGVYSGNATVPLAVGLAVQQNVPQQALAVLEGTVPSAVPYTSGQMTAPITIPPGADVPPLLVYAMKQKSPVAFGGVLVK